MTNLAFVDTETTSLRHDRRAWEIAVIVREPWIVQHPDGPDTVEARDAEHTWLIHERDLDLGNADLMSLRVGRFHERHPCLDLPERAYMDSALMTPVLGELDALWQVEHLTRGAHLAGAVVSFDADVLGQRMRARGICPSWHYHLIDVEALAAGKLGVQPPWKSDDLSAALGVAVSEDARHTALGDARWARDIYDKVMAPSPSGSAP